MHDEFVGDHVALAPFTSRRDTSVDFFYRDLALSQVPPLDEYGRWDAAIDPISKSYLVYTRHNPVVAEFGGDVDGLRLPFPRGPHRNRAFD